MSIPSQSRNRRHWKRLPHWKRALRRFAQRSLDAFGAGLGKRAALAVAQLIEKLLRGIVCALDPVPALVALNIAAAVVCYRRACADAGSRFLRLWGSCGIIYYINHFISVLIQGTPLPQDLFRVVAETLYATMSLALFAHAIESRSFQLTFTDGLWRTLSVASMIAIPAMMLVSPAHVSLAVSVFGALAALNVLRDGLLEPSSELPFVLYACGLCARGPAFAMYERAVGESPSFAVILILLIMPVKALFKFRGPSVRSTVPLKHHYAATE